MRDTASGRRYLRRKTCRVGERLAERILLPSDGDAQASDRFIRADAADA